MFLVACHTLHTFPAVVYTGWPSSSVSHRRASKRVSKSAGHQVGRWLAISRIHMTSHWPICDVIVFFGYLSTFFRRLYLGPCVTSSQCTRPRAVNWQCRMTGLRRVSFRQNACIHLDGREDAFRPRENAITWVPQKCRHGRAVERALREAA